MLLLHAVIFSLFRSLDAFNELNCVEVWMMFLTSRSVFFALGAAKGCISASLMQAVRIFAKHFSCIYQ